MRVIAAIIAALPLAAGTAAAADEAPICADRPGKANATCTAPAGHFQIETGLTDWSLKHGGGTRETLLLVGGTAIKYGLTDRSHVEVDFVPWERATARAGDQHERASGPGDLVVRYKYQLTGARAPVQVALYPFLKAPTARRSLGNREVEAGLDLPFGYAIPQTRLSIALMPELSWLADGDGSGHHLVMSQAAGVGWQATDKLNLSAEFWAMWDWDAANTEKQVSVDGAAAYLLSSRIQLDAGANVGLNKQTPDVELYTGVSVRF